MENILVVNRQGASKQPFILALGVCDENAFPASTPSRRCLYPTDHKRRSRGGGGGGLGVRFEGIVTLLWEVFGIKNDIISYNISSSPIDHYKKTVAIPLLDSSIIQMQHRFSDEDCHARHLLRLVQSILINKALQLGRMKLKAYCSGRKTFHFSNLLEMRLVDGKHSGCQQIGSFQTTFYFSTWRLQ